MRDSVQVSDLAPREGKWCDLGSGAGFPGMVAAITSRTDAPDRRFSLVESDQRKTAFLRTVARETGVTCHVISNRIEETPQLEADIVTARALADLATLLEYATRHMRPDGVAIFPKGSNWRKEIADARTNWSFECDPIQSMTNPEAAILIVRGIERV